MALWDPSKNTESNEILNCCIRMQNMSSDTGGRGFSFKILNSKSEFPWDEGPVISFVSVDEEDVDKLPYTPVAISLSSSLEIKFCPFCGSALRRSNLSKRRIR